MFCYCAQSRRIARALTARYDAALAKANLTAGQFETLGVLQALNDGSGSALAQRLAVDKTTLSRNLKPLIEAKLVTARRGEQDAREIRYALSAAGQRRLAKAMPLWQAAHAQTETLLGKQAAGMERALQTASALLA